MQIGDHMSIFSKIKSFFTNTDTPVGAPYKIETPTVINPLPVGTESVVVTPQAVVPESIRDEVAKAPAKPKAPANPKVEPKPKAPAKPRTPKPTTK